MSEHYNRIASDFLTRRGFKCDADLSWLGPGLIPDLFCRGPCDLWVEVKAPSPPLDDERLGRLFSYLRANVDPTIGRGWIRAHIAGTATERDTKSALALLRDAFRLPEALTAKEIYAIVPNDPDYATTVHFTVEIEGGKALFVCKRAKSGGYGYPYYFEPTSHSEVISINGDVQRDQPKPFYDIATDANFRVSLGVTLNDKPLEIMMASRAEGAKPTGTVEQLRAAIKAANKQIKRALEVREAPAIVFIFHRGVLVGSDETLLAALFGDIQYSFSRDRFDEGEFGFGPNAIWHASLHRSVSAVSYFRNDAEPTTIYNPWAARPLQPRLLGGREYVPQPDGRLTLIESA